MVLSHPFRATFGQFGAVWAAAERFSVGSTSGQCWLNVGFRSAAVIDNGTKKERCLGVGRQVHQTETGGTADHLVNVVSIVALELL